MARDWWASFTLLTFMSWSRIIRGSLVTLSSWSAVISVADSAGGSGESGSPPDACLQLNFLHRRDGISLFNWLIFLKMKCALHCGTKLNISRDIKKCNWFWIPSYGLFVSAHKAVFPEPTETSVHRLSKMWSSLKNSWIYPCVWL